MRYLAAAKRYALALQEAAQELKIPQERTAEELIVLTEIWNTNTVIQKILLNPVINKAEKKTIIKKILDSTKFSAICGNLLLILVDKDRLNILPAISEIFSQYVAKEKKKAAAFIKSATKLSLKQKERIKNKLSKLFDKKDIVIQTETDSSLLGGMVINIGSERIDATVKNKLQEIQQAISRK